MILLRQQLEIKPYLPQPFEVLWLKTAGSGADIYCLESPGAKTNLFGLAEERNREPVQTGCTVAGKITLLESGAILASFPLGGLLPGKIVPDPLSVWFNLDAPVRIPAGLTGREMEIPPGRHLMALAPDCWLVFFRPLKG